MNTPFGRKSFVDRVGKMLGRKPRRSRRNATRSGLVSLGAVAGVTALSAVVSAIRQRQDEGGRDDRS